MNKSHIADRLAGRMGLSRSAAAGSVDAVFETIGEALTKTRGGADLRNSALSGRSTGRPARAAITRTGEAVSIPASVAPAFRAGKALKDAVNGALASATAAEQAPAFRAGKVLREAASGTGGRGTGVKPAGRPAIGIEARKGRDPACRGSVRSTRARARRASPLLEKEPEKPWRSGPGRRSAAGRGRCAGPEATSALRLKCGWPGATIMR